MSPSRIDELRRRVQNDPASIAFAQLAEEYRRSGQTDEAVRVCREGLTRHPGYLSARVTLGRALLDLGQLAEARGEFEFVVVEAPENLAAVRGLAEIFHRDGQTDEALTYYRRALALARHDPEIEEIVQQLSRQVGAAAAGPSGGGLSSFEEAHQELLSAAERVPLAPPAAAAPARAFATEGATAPFDFERLVAALGSPAPPPQVEAAVAGRPMPTIDLPDTVDLGPNPFAALEAELRAHDTVSDAAPVAWPPAYDAGVEAAVTASEQSAAHENEALSAFELPVPSASDATDVIPDVDAIADSQLAPDVPFATEPDSASPVSAWSEAPVDAEPVAEAEPNGEPQVDLLAEPVADVIAAGPTVAAPDGPAVSGDERAAEDAGAEDAAPQAPAAREKEDVLGDLESWLSTLHDRSGS